MTGKSTAPDDETLRALRRQGLSQTQIAERFNVSRQTVGNWLRGAHLPSRVSHFPGSEPVAHKDILPWTIRGADHQDQIARALRWYNKQQHGDDLTDQQQAGVDRLLDYLEKHGRVVDYTREEGFVLRPRTAGVDADGDIIRRPPSPVAV